MDTTNPNCFVYEAGELTIELLGGVRIDTLDRMRVTMKVSVTNRKYKAMESGVTGLSVRHNLDLYNDVQVEKFVKRVAERLEVGSIAVTKAIADITSQLEVYRLTQLDKKHDRQVKALSEHERNEAIAFLQSKSLLEVTNAMIGKSGMISEDSIMEYGTYRILVVYGCGFCRDITAVFRGCYKGTAPGVCHSYHEIKQGCPLKRGSYYSTCYFHYFIE